MVEMEFVDSMSSGAPPAVEVRGLVKQYGHATQPFWALRGVDLTVEAGDFVALTGRSGSGKTSLLYAIGGLDEPTRGTVRLFGTPIETMSDRSRADMRRRDIGFIFQFYNLLDQMPAWENVAIPLVLEGVSLRKAKARAREWLARVGMADHASQPVQELSGGQMQLTAVARALVMQPRLVLADEPTGNLDSQSGARVLEVLDNLVAREGRTVLLVTHDQQVADLAPRQVQLRDGTVHEL
jgi:putative ABC transport system ATP-binding protein